MKAVGKAGRGGGFTLLELMISVSLIAVTLLAAVTVILNAMHLETQAKELNKAKNACELEMQRLRGLDFLDLLNLIDTQGNGTFYQGNFAVAGLSVRPSDGDGMCGWFEVRKRAGAVNDNLVDITVRVEWRGKRGGDQVFQLVSMRSDRGLRWQAP